MNGCAHVLCTTHQDWFDPSVFRRYVTLPFASIHVYNCLSSSCPLIVAIGDAERAEMPFFSCGGERKFITTRVSIMRNILYCEMYGEQFSCVLCVQRVQAQNMQRPRIPNEGTCTRKMSYVPRITSKSLGYWPFGIISETWYMYGAKSVSQMRAHHFVIKFIQRLHCTEQLVFTTQFPLMIIHSLAGCCRTWRH